MEKSIYNWILERVITKSVTFSMKNVFQNASYFDLYFLA